MSENLPRLFRPNRALIVAVAPLLANDAYLGMSERDFTGAVMQASGGAANPKRVSDLYWQLIAEANVKPPQ